MCACVDAATLKSRDSVMECVRCILFAYDIKISLSVYPLHEEFQASWKRKSRKIN